METVIENIFLWVLYFVSLSIYVFLIAEIIPKYLLKMHIDAGYTLGRGLKKFVYPDGRAVIYEPHPSMRKYVKKYALFTLDGYKYLQLCIDEKVKNYVARVVMFDNQDKILDVCEISEVSVAMRTPSPVKLHSNTSYISLSLLEANRTPMAPLSFAKMRMRDMALYFIAVVVATFFQFVHLVATIDSLYDLSYYDISIPGGYAFFILPAIIIGGVCLAITVSNRTNNGVKVVFK